MKSTAKSTLQPAEKGDTIQSTEKKRSYLAIFTYDNNAVYEEQDKASKAANVPELEYMHRKRSHKFLHAINMELLQSDSEEKKRSILLKVFATVRESQDDIVRSMLANGMYEKGSKITEAATMEALDELYIMKVRVLEITDGEEFSNFITDGPVDWYMDADSDAAGGLAISNNRMQYLIPGCSPVTTLWDLTKKQGEENDTKKSSSKEK